ncbi:unnamed protein product [Rotaria magnacalcarata]|uniref:VCBS repeat-containing protein n=1 Tax=Rotaria magnacalcarata TaxID=392030 RepID=A0A814IBQ9_9BILA|nr:unnamed protein product [Rotaria magnacalcarata]CAF4132184.1 unnamed protein product [Rotaria magnacalcarata]
MVNERYTNDIDIFFGYENGQFLGNSVTVVTSSSVPYSIVVDHFNNDSAFDFVVANYDHYSIGVFLRYGNGTFENERIHFISSSRPLSLAVHDLNQDQQLDLIVANDGTSDGGVLLGYGDGNFTNPKTLSTGFDSLSHAIVVGDFNDDTRPDIAVVNTGTNTIGVLLCHGDGTFSNQTAYPTGNHPIALYIGDFDNDTLLDIVVTNDDDNNTGIFLGNGNETFKNQTTYTTGVRSQPSSVVVRNFSRDGQLDIVIANAGATNVALLLRKGDGTLENQRIYPSTMGSPRSVAVADFDNDS